MSGIPPKPKATAYNSISRRTPAGQLAGSSVSPHSDAAVPEMRASPVAGFS
jgi:hypothetical protein